MAKRTTDNIEKISDNAIANFHDTFIIIDSDEYNQTFKMRLSELLDTLSLGFFDFGLAFSDGDAVSFEGITIAKIERGLN